MEVTLDITAFTEVGLSKEESTVLEAASLLVAHYSKSGLMEKLPPQSSIWVQRAKDALQVVRAPFSEKLPRRIRWRDVAIVLMEMNRLKKSMAR